MNRRALYMGGAALVALIMSVIAVNVFSKDPPPPPAIIATTQPAFAVHTANDLYTAETLLNGINLERWKADLKEIDTAISEMYKASATPTATPQK